MPIKKRFIAAINVKDNLAVQSINYSKYLPLGKVENFVECYDRWNVDEIFIQDFTRSFENKGPNISLIKKISSLRIKTPIIYGGGIQDALQATNVINSGADRIVLGNIFFRKHELIKQISEIIGSQAIILSLPIIKKNNKILFYNYLKKKLLTYSDVIKKIYELQDFFSEILITDIANQGHENNFDIKILDNFKNLNKPIIFYGGIGYKKIESILKLKKSAGFAIGNALAFNELSYQQILKKIKSNLLKSPFYFNEDN